GRLPQNTLQTATRYSYALIPLGFAMWLAHYSFHFFTSYNAVLPATKRLLVDLGYNFVGAPEWSCACCAPIAGWLLRAEIVSLELGLLLSLYTGYRIARSQTSQLMPAVK